MNSFSKFLILGLVSSSATIASAQDASKASPDTLGINTFRAFKTVAFRSPFMSDSIGINGEKYDANGKLGSSTFMNTKDKSAQVVSADKAGFIVAKKKDKSDEKVSYITTYTTNINCTRYEKGNILIESTLPFRAFLDGKLIAQSDKSTHRDSIKTPTKASVTISPTAHQLVIRTIETSKDSIDMAMRVRYASASNGSGVLVTTDDTKYIDLDFMLHGDNLTKVSMSPSGKYVIMSKRVYFGGKHNTEYHLYKGNKKIRTLGQIGDESWLPGVDKLYFTREKSGSRALMTFDPETEQEEIIHSSIPQGNFSMSPSGNYLIFYDHKEGPKVGKHSTRVLGRGDREQNFRHRYFISLFDLKTGLYNPITYGFRTTALQDMSEDDSKLIFSVSETTTKRPFFTSDFIELDLRTMKADTLFKKTSDVSQVSYTSKPGMLLVQGTANAFDGVGRNLPDGAIVNTYDKQMFLYNADSKKATPLTKYFNPSINDVYVSPKLFSAYFTAEDEDRMNLYRCDLGSGKITRLSHKEDFVRSFGVSEDGKMMTYVGQSMNNSDRMYLISGRNNKEELVYDLSAVKLEGYKLGDAKVWDFTMPNGDVVPGRFYLPPNFDANKKYPLIVYYYGGTAPTSRRFENAYAPHLYTSQDYVVYIVNPSGTTGYGQEYASRHVNAWGKRTADEIIASVKGFCAAHSFINDKKIGCMGASYGGFMTQYLQTVTDIFAAAVSHAGISALSSYWGEGFWGVGYSTVASTDSYPWNNPDLYVRQSPLFNADKINTPLLLLHGTVDTNVPDGESVQMYNALKILGKEVEFIRIHNQDHFILEEPKRIEWTNSIFAWFAKWLKDDATWWDDMHPKVNL